MLSNKNNKRKSSRNNKKTKKRTNIKTKNRKYRKNTKSKTLIGGAGQYPQRSFQYNYVYTLGTKGLRTMWSMDKQFSHPGGVAVSAADNRIYVVDSSNHRVQVFDGATRNYIATLGTTGSRGYSNTQFSYPQGVAVSAIDNRIYVADSANHRVQVFDGDTLAYIATLGTTGSLGTSNTQFTHPIGVAVSAADNRIYVADQGNRRVQVFDGASRNYDWIATLGTTGSKGSSNTQFYAPRGVAVSAADNRIYVVDSNHCVQVFDGTTGNYELIATLGTGSDGASNTQFNYPQGVAVSSTDNLIYVADYDNHRVQIFDGATRNYIATLGTTGSKGASNTKFNKPVSIAVSEADNRIYVADSNNNRVQVFDKIELPPQYNSVPSYTPGILNKGYKHNGTIYETKSPSPKYVQSLSENTSARQDPTGNPNLVPYNVFNPDNYI